MDNRDFDLLTRRLASTASRRGVLRAGLAFAGAVIGLGAVRESDAAGKRSVGNSCNTNSDCASGLCVQQSRTRKICGCQSAADCPAVNDSCHSATCSAGACGVAVNAGVSCDDGNPCTHNDVCQPNGTCVGTPVTCAASDQCHVAGSCDPATGNCTNPTADSGTLCDDGNACTSGDHCVLGECQGTSIICQPVDDPAGCWNQPTCDPATGTCSNATPKASGSPCDDGNLCTTSVCDGAGTCSGTAKSCGESFGTCPQKCDPATGACVAGDNGDACTPSYFEQCQTGVCQDGGCVAVTAPVGSPCSVLAFACQSGAGVCDSNGRCAPVTAVDGTACSPLTSLSECQLGICQSGDCVVANAPDGTACGDNSAVDCDRQSCQAGVCADVSRIGERCEVDLHGCLHYTCQASGCLYAHKTDDCNSTISCGGFGTCTEQLPGVGTCIPNVCDDCCGGVCGKTECTLVDGTKTCLPSNQVCEGLCYPDPVRCCGISFEGTIGAHVATCKPTEQCCIDLAGGYVCCSATAPCGINGCSPVGV